MITKEQEERFKQARDLVLKHQDDPEQEKEVDRAWSTLKTLNKEGLVFPKCCVEAERQLRWYVSLECDGAESYWILKGVLVAFCPFCGTKLPMPVKVQTNVPQVKSEEGFYCDECEERLSICVCLNPSVPYKLES